MQQTKETIDITREIIQIDKSLREFDEDEDTTLNKIEATESLRKEKVLYLIAYELRQLRRVIRNL